MAGITRRNAPDPVATRNAPKKSYSKPMRASRSYNVGPGESVSSIARGFGTTTNSLIGSNPGLNMTTDFVRPYTRLNVPQEDV